MMTDASLQQRLETLRAEYEKGQHQLEALERQRQDVRDTLLRISGAIQVLEELQASNGKSDPA
jgi:prefoldin subunit 5